jgi:amino acid transporter
VPSGNWFVPAVEMGIALSIIYAAVFAVSQRGRDSRSETTMFLITTTIGLLHGLGFSFVLHEILQVDSPNIWQSLLAFNLGVEIGQVLIILAAWPLFRLIARWNDRAWAVGRWGVAVPCVAVAAVWTAQRALMVIRAL